MGLKTDHLAQRWVFDKDPLAYYLMMAAIYADNTTQRNSLLDLMSDNQRTLAKRARDGSWKRY